jgi:hypothetical protein
VAGPGRAVAGRGRAVAGQGRAGQGRARQGAPQARPRAAQGAAFHAAARAGLCRRSATTLPPLVPLARAWLDAGEASARAGAARPPPPGKQPVREARRRRGPRP